MPLITPTEVKQPVQEAHIIEHKKETKNPNGRKKISFKQKQFAKEFIKSQGNGTQSALKVYDTTSRRTASDIAMSNLASPPVREYINSLLEREGITDNWIAEKIKTAIVEGLGVKAKNSDSLKGLDMLMRVKDIYPVKKSASLNVSVNASRQDLANLSPEELVKKLETMQKMTALLLQDLKDGTKPSDIVS